jgi:hypothetical protein
MIFSRRHLLRIGAVGVTGGLVGCTQLAQPKSTVRLGDIVLGNGHATDRTATVYIERDGDPVFATAVDVPASENRVLTDGWPTAPGRFVIAVAHDGSTQPETIELTGEGCQSVIAELDPADVSFFGPATDADRCTQ